MATQRQLQETVARCVSAMVSYHNCERSEKVHDRMVGEVQMIAGFLEELGLGRGEIDHRVILPVEAELIARFGQVTGSRLAIQFVEGLESLDIPRDRRPFRNAAS
jgi:hypothetical protein